MFAKRSAFRAVLQNNSMATFQERQPGEKRPRLFCQHCQQSVSNSTYYRHRERFFDTAKKTWVNGTDGSLSDSSSGDSWEDPDISLDDTITAEADG
jgi:hypothetical protein